MRWLFIFTICTHLQSAERFLETLYPSWGQSFEISQVLHREKTDLWELSVFETPLFGKVLSIDGAIQLTEADEAIYSEMMAHVPLFTHGSASSVLILGGGDGCILREVLRHAGVERVFLVEIDPGVIEISKRFFPALTAGAFEDPRVRIAIQDASEFVKTTSERFDVIICDSTDPIGPAAVLFSKEFYGRCRALLKKGGIFVNQTGVPFMQKEELQTSFRNRKDYFKDVGFYTTPVPTYAGGFLAIGWASNRKYRVPQKLLEKRMGQIKGDFQYYTPAIHKASFHLPAYMKGLLKNQ